MEKENWEEQLENLGDYHKVNGEDVYDPPSMDELKTFIRRLLKKAQNEAKFDKSFAVHDATSKLQ